MVKPRKVALIGTGAVGTSFLYSAINTGLAEEYLLIDLFKDFAEGQALDLEDTNLYVSSKFNSIKAGEYKDLKDYNLVVITAGRPQKEGETRLEMISDNANIMKNIAIEVKKSGFKGITVIASNPVDIMAAVYQEVTYFNKRKVISSGTSLDTSRLRVALGKALDINAAAIKAYVLGEHGDSSISTLSTGKVGLSSLVEFAKNKNISKSHLDQIHQSVWKKAYEIIDKKRTIHYGIGAALNKISTMILRDEKNIITVGAKLEGQYGEKDFYTGTPCILGINGIEHIIEVPLSKEEKEGLDKSFKVIKDATKIALKSIK